MNSSELKSDHAMLTGAGAGAGAGRGAGTGAGRGAGTGAGLAATCERMNVIMQ